MFGSLARAAREKYYHRLNIEDWELWMWLTTSCRDIEDCCAVPGFLVDSEAEQGGGRFRSNHIQALTLYVPNIPCVARRREPRPS